MKTSPASSRRRLLASTGAVLGMLATVGLAAPAQAAVVTPSAPVIQTDRNNDHDGDHNRNGNNNDWNRNYNTGNNHNNRHDGDNDRNHNRYDNDRNHNRYDNDRNHNRYDNDRNHNRYDNDRNHNRNRHNNDADLHLRIDRDGDYRIRGNDFDDNRVRVVLRDVSRGRTVDAFTVYPNNNGDFTVRGDDLRCNRTYQATSWSNDDGREWSNKVYFHCDHHK
jgi:hypothetical protein